MSTVKLCSLRSRLLPAALLAAVPLLALGGQGASAAPVSAVPHPPPGAQIRWEPYRTQPFESPAGTNCSFTLRGDPVVDEEEVATWSRYPDGSPRWQTIRGDLRVRYTNVESGAAVEKDLDGVGTVHYLPDGATTLYLVGPAAVGFNQTDPYPAGFYALDGLHVVHTTAGRTSRSMVLDRGTEQDVCAELD